MSLSVVIPAHNEAPLIHETLDSVCANEFEDRMEIVVVASGCTDQTYDTVDSYFRERVPYGNHQLLESGRGKQIAINVGTAAARGSEIICIDADVMPAPQTLTELSRRLATQQQTRLVGSLALPNPERLPPNSLLSTIIRSEAIRKAAVGVRKSVQGGCMGWRAADSIVFPDSVTPDDVWVSAHVADKYGLDAIDVSMGHRTYFTPPQTWPDYIRMNARYAVAHRLLEIEYPELYPTVAEVTGYIEGFRSNSKIDAIWKAECDEAGIDFSAILPVHAGLKRVIADLVPATTKELIRQKGIWQPVGSTKIAHG